MTGGEEFRQTIRNIVDQLRIEQTSNEPKPVAKTRPIADKNAKFAMGNGTERMTARKSRMTVFSWSLAILTILIIVHLWLSVIDVNSRIRNTTRLMTAIRQGTPLGRVWKESETEDHSSKLSP
ncbi:hypothetical protein [Thalassoroseus pseudoceratinae]|uniref:hypothetical protein n=1 Tax=Thalassoroseus pseudoceratinae TaxID=2713176 RepID=UPI001423BF43|nr:hypothetical protein [Thalassoroseus pseudoceratinae]